MAKKMKYELLNISNNQISVEQDVIAKIRMIQLARKQAEELDARLKLELRNAMEECGVKKYENDLFSVTYIAPHDTTRVDSDKLKKDGLYDEYSYTIETSASVRIKMKE